MTWFWGNESEPVTAVLNEFGLQLFETAGLLSVQVDESKSFSQHKLENGKTVTDNEITNQVRINLQLILDADDYIQVYQEIKTEFEASAPITIQTRVETYDNLYIEAIPHDESGDIANTIAITINLIEQQIVPSSSETIEEADTDNSADTTTTSSGQKTPSPDANTEASEASGNTTVLDDLLGGFL